MFVERDFMDVASENGRESGTENQYFSHPPARFPDESQDEFSKQNMDEDSFLGPTSMGGEVTRC